MKKLLVTLLVAATTLNFAACGNKGGNDKKEATNSKDLAVTISVQVEESWLPYYEKVKEAVLKDYPKCTIEFKTTGSFDHLDVIDSTDPTNEDVADVFALPADRLYGLAKNQVLAAIDAKAMAEKVGGFGNYDEGLGGNLKVDGEYLAFPYNIEALVAYVNVQNAKTAGVDTTKTIEFTDLAYNQILTTVHDCWYGVAFANSGKLELLGKKDDGTLYSDATKKWADLTAEQKAVFEGLFNYYSDHAKNKTDLWDKDAASGYIDNQFKTGGSDVIKIDGPWATTSIKDLVGGADNIEVLPLSKITFEGQPLSHWQGGWGLGINSRNEEDADKMALCEAFIEEVVNPANAKEVFEVTGKILPNVDASAFEGVDPLDKKVIEATYESYKNSVARPLFEEWGSVWASWQNALLSWSSTNPKNAEEAYEQVRASFEAMMANF